MSFSLLHITLWFSINIDENRRWLGRIDTVKCTCINWLQKMKSRTILVLGKRNLFPRRTSEYFNFRIISETSLERKMSCYSLSRCYRHLKLNLLMVLLSDSKLLWHAFITTPFSFSWEILSRLQRMTPAPTSSMQTPVVSSTWISFIPVPTKPSFSHSPG